MKDNSITITPLGTVSPYCKDNKNCPGFLISKNNKRILLDCGEGISRMLNLSTDLNNLIIIISNLHKDHYSGLLNIGYASYVYKNLGYLKDRIKVYIPNEDIFSDIEHYEDEDGWGCSRKVNRQIIDYEYLTNFNTENYLMFENYNETKRITYGDLEISFKTNPHQLKTYSTKITGDEGTIVYSSDTGYQNNRLESFAKNADLLICDSTFLKGQYKSEDSHLYAYEAAEIAKKANVKQLMLTHFWPEIDKQRYVVEAKEIFENTIAAEEGKKLILRKQ